MKRGKSDSKKFLETAHKRFEQAVNAEQKQRERWLDDLRFEAGEQWPESIRRIREKDPANPRPCITINKTQLHCRQVINDLRQNRPQIKVLPVDGSADLETAEIYAGLIRNIETTSDADIAYDTAMSTQVPAGIGYFRINTTVIDARLNTQEIKFEPIWNPLSVYFDPEIQHPAGADARWCFVVEDVPEATFTESYPNAKTVDWRDKGRGDSTNRNWFPTTNTIRVAEYYYLERKLEKFYDVDGEVYDAQGYEKAGSPQPVTIREQYINCCYWAKLTGAEILEETEIPTQYVPVLRVAGRETVIDGERDVRGMVRDMKDPARLYNYWVTANTEAVALSPKAPLIAPFEALEGHESYWDRANVENLPYLPYNHIDDSGNPVPAPTRAQPPQQSTAMVQAIIQADNDLMGVAGRFEASLGEAGNEKSGRAIIARQRQGDNATFHYSDNLSRAIRHAGRILVDMIPKIYDTPRMLRVLGEDSTPEFAQIDPQAPRAMVEQEDLTGKVRKVFNLGLGKYDVTCVAGPSYATKRQEAAEALIQLSQADPTMMQKAGDLVIKALDIPNADELAKRMKAFLPPEILQQEAGEDDTQAQIQQAGAMAQEQLMAEIGPQVQAMQQALMQAEQTAQQQAAQVEQLQRELANREAEMAARIQEAQIKADAESQKAEQETLRVVLQAALQPEEEQREERPEKPESAPQPTIVMMGQDDTKQAVAALMAQMDELRAEVMKPKRKQVRVTEFDADGLPVAAEVIEE